MTYDLLIQRCIDFIEERIDSDLSMEAIAGWVHISVSHLYRIFPYLTGQMVGAYIRKRRLLLSAGQLLTTDKRILDIALDAGFESQESYIRAFKDLFGIIPGAYRRGQAKFPIFYSLSLLDVAKKEITMQPSFIRKQMTLVGLCAEIDLARNFTPIFDDLRAAMKIALPKIRHLVKPVRRVGIWMPHITHYTRYAEDVQGLRLLLYRF